GDRGQGRRHRRRRRHEPPDGRQVAAFRHRDRRGPRGRGGRDRARPRARRRRRAALTAAAPVPTYLQQRLPLLDVLRGFALPGIALMNIEWFTRPPGELGDGVPAQAEGLEYATGWLVHVLVQGKFWLLFALLFGAGFMVMRHRL